MIALAGDAELDEGNIFEALLEGWSGPLAALYRHYGIDANAIVAAVQAVAPGRPIRYLKALP